MANITVLALDPQTGDLCFDANGMLMIREDAEAIAQNVRNNLLTWKGEFPLNTDHGTDWERVVQQPRSEAVDEADSVVRSSIFQEPYVQEISSLSMTADGRALGVEFSGVLYNGEPDRQKPSRPVPAHFCMDTQYPVLCAGRCLQQPLCGHSGWHLAAEPR